MILKSTLTATVLTTAHDVWKQKDNALDRYVMSLLASYYAEYGECQKDSIYRTCSGERRIPSKIARYYAEDTNNLYEDIACYYDMVPRLVKEALWDSLGMVLEIIPHADRDDILIGIGSCAAEKCTVCMLYTLLLEYAWHVDIAGYTYVAAKGGGPTHP